MNKVNDEAKHRNNIIDFKTYQDAGEEAFKIPFLSIDGEQALKRITFLLSLKQGKIDYNPYLLKTMAIMLIFLK